MKRIFSLTILCLMTLALLGRMPANAADIKDVKPDHWAYQAIQHLVDKGYMAIYDDQTFRGDKPVSRMVFAAALYKLIQEVGASKVSLTGADATKLKQLQEEFAADIADYETRIEKLQKKIETLEAGATSNVEVTTAQAYEINKRADSIEDKNVLQDRSIDILNSQVETLNADLQKERKARKSFQTLAIVGIIAAIAVGAGG